ncbi:RES family NAD+ phosphorylase [Rhodococcus sp. H29-C3]|nr:RES family NAD+ phosphorylase [Rhodococcus sp. H29-C3]
MPLPVGAELWRIHSGTYAANAVNPTAQPAIPGGARFDSLTGDYAYTYVGDSPEAAVAETLCRNLPVTGTPRLVPRISIAGRVLSRLTVIEPVTVIAVHGPHLSAIGQDTWLTKSDPADYVLTRTWASALFAAAPSANGLLYRCRHNEDQFAWMLTTHPTNQVHPALEAAGDAVQLDSPTGTALVDRILAYYNATFASPI